GWGLDQEAVQRRRWAASVFPLCLLRHSRSLGPVDLMTESTTQETPQAGDRPPRRREPAFNIAGVALAILGACVAIQLARMYLLGPDANDRLIQDFAFLPARYTGGYTFNFILAVVSPFT